MVGFKNRYMVVEVNLNPNRDQLKDDPMTLTPYNVTKAIKDCILLNFGECGLASSVASFQGSIKACKNAALKCEEWKFEQRKVVAGASLSAEVSRQMQGCLDKIKVLEH
ncbi:hypothetical protein L484_000524 [Morus notabilis]|uniref:Uncharacterized protein n=1 Tax=Morus notabilis TaxID=981085 RepID=W9SPF4_9ROSA|nr:hypothetical protein L484_000524 [Morus notabilis]